MNNIKHINMKRSSLFIGIVAALSLVACQKEVESATDSTTPSTTPNPTYDPETNTVTTKFVISISTSADKDTKTTADYVQHNKPFLGMEAVHLLTYSQTKPSATHGYYFYTPFRLVDDVLTPVSATRDYNLGSLFPEGVVDEDNATRVLDLALPLGTNNVMLYGKALKTESDDLQGKVRIDGNPSDITSLYFQLAPRLDNQAAYETGTFLFANMLTYFLTTGLVDEENFWNHATGNADKSYKVWWPVPSAADLAELPAILQENQQAIVGGNTYVYTNGKWKPTPDEETLAQLPSDPIDNKTYTLYKDTPNEIQYTFHKGQLSWKQLGRMYEYAYDENDATDPNTVASTENNRVYGLSALGEVLGNAYQSLTTLKIDNQQKIRELRAGAASAVLRTMQDLYAIAKSASNADPTGWEEEVAKELAAQLVTRMQKFFAEYENDELDFIRTAAGIPNIAAIKTSLESSCTPTRWNSMKGTINTYLDEDYFVTSSSAGFPVNIGLPKGAAVLICSTSSDFPENLGGTTKGNMKAVDQFAYTEDVPAYGFGVATTFPISNYRYPAELMYYGNSPLRTNTSTVGVDKYPSSVSAWSSEGNQWAGWEKNSSVKSDTRSVAMVNSINYGTALLATTVKFADGAIYDNNAALHPGEEDQEIILNSTNPKEGFFVSGVLVSGMADKVGWDFTRKCSNPGANAVTYDFESGEWTGFEFEGNPFNKIIYDRVPASVPYKVGTTAEPMYTMVWDNYDAEKDADNQSDAFIGLELVNNTGQDIWGEMNLIRKGGTFYLLGKLDLSAALEKAGDDFFAGLDRDYYCYPPYDPTTGKSINVPRVFMQDYITKANLVIGPESLKHAYITVPDLRSGQVSLGLSIDMSWTTGLEFDDVVMGN